MNGLLGGLFNTGMLGSAQQSGTGLANGYNPYQQMNNQMASQQAMLGQYAQQYAPKRWMIDGVGMEFEQFIDTLYPEDCPEKSYLILKFKKENK